MPISKLLGQFCEVGQHQAIGDPLVDLSDAGGGSTSVAGEQHIVEFDEDEPITKSLGGDPGLSPGVSREIRGDGHLLLHPAIGGYIYLLMGQFRSSHFPLGGIPYDGDGGSVVNFNDAPTRAYRRSHTR